MIFEVFIEVKMWIGVFWVVTLCSLVGGYQLFGEMYPRMEEMCSSKTLVTIYQSKRCHNTEDHNPQLLKKKKTTNTISCHYKDN
jgi:hypothetical protein